MKISNRKISAGCILGVGHFNKCDKPKCACVCHEIDGEVDYTERVWRRREEDNIDFTAMRERNILSATGPISVREYKRIFDTNYNKCSKK